MRVYVESNFVLELVLEQEQHLACREIVRLAEAGIIELVVPAFGLLEPYMTLHRRHREQEEERERALGQRECTGRASHRREYRRLSAMSCAGCRRTGW